MTSGTISVVLLKIIGNGGAYRKDKMAKNVYFYNRDDF
jgi:hypothetical protein